MTIITANDHKRIARGLRRLLVKEFRRYKNVQYLSRTKHKAASN